jgi:hypothetical protein
MGATFAQAQSPCGIGRAAAPAEITGWNIDIDRDGHNLPPGNSSVSRARNIRSAMRGLSRRKRRGRHRRSPGRRTGQFATADEMLDARTLPAIKMPKSKHVRRRSAARC